MVLKLLLSTYRTRLHIKPYVSNIISIVFTEYLIPEHRKTTLWLTLWVLNTGSLTISPAVSSYTAQPPTRLIRLVISVTIIHKWQNELPTTRIDNSKVNWVFKGHKTKVINRKVRGCRLIELQLGVRQYCYSQTLNSGRITLESNDFSNKLVMTHSNQLVHCRPSHSICNHHWSRHLQHIIKQNLILQTFKGLSSSELKKLQGTLSVITLVLD